MSGMKYLIDFLFFVTKFIFSQDIYNDIRLKEDNMKIVKINEVKKNPSAALFLRFPM
jgi:hypothetical protein